MGKRVIFIADSLDNAYKFQQVLSRFDVEIAAGSTVQVSKLLIGSKGILSLQDSALLFFSRLKILFMTQADIKPSKFIIFVNDPELMHFSYLRFIENRLREMYGFEGTPLRLIVRARDEEEDY